MGQDRKSTRLNSSHQIISYAVFCLKKKKKKEHYSYQIKSPDVFCAEKNTSMHVQRNKALSVSLLEGSTHKSVNTTFDMLLRRRLQHSLTTPTPFLCSIFFLLSYYIFKYSLDCPIAHFILLFFLFFFLENNLSVHLSPPFLFSFFFFK